MKSKEIKFQLEQLHNQLVARATELTFKVQKQLERFELSNGFTANGYGSSYIVGIYDGEEQNFTLHSLSDSDLLELISQLEEDIVEEETEFRIPVKWESFGIVNIKAKTLRDAFIEFESTKEKMPLPEPKIIEGSFRRYGIHNVVEHNGGLYKLNQIDNHSVSFNEEDQTYLFTDGIKAVLIPVVRFDINNITFMESNELIKLIDMLLC